MKFREIINEVENTFLPDNEPDILNNDLVQIILGYITTNNFISLCAEDYFWDWVRYNSMSHALRLLGFSKKNQSLHYVSSAFAIQPLEKGTIDDDALSTALECYPDIKPRHKPKVIAKFKELNNQDIARIFVSRAILPLLMEKTLNPHDIFGISNEIYNARNTLPVKIREFLKVASDVISIEPHFQLAVQRNLLSLLESAFDKQITVPETYETAEANTILHALEEGQFNVKACINKTIPLIHLALQSKGSLDDKLELLNYILSQSPSSINDLDQHRNTLLHLPLDLKIAEALLDKGIEIRENKFYQESHPDFKDLIATHKKKRSTPIGSTFKLHSPETERKIPDDEVQIHYKLVEALGLYDKEVQYLKVQISTELQSK